QSTLLVMKGLVQLQESGVGNFVTVTADRPVKVGDHIKTGPDGFAVVTYFDGSTTSLNPSAEITLNKMDKLADGGKNISFGQVFTVTVEPGFQTIVNPGQPPTPPEPAPPSNWAFLLNVSGPVSFFLTDSNGRSAGFHPDADAFVNQIPGAKYSVGGGGQSLKL